MPNIGNRTNHTSIIDSKHIPVMKSMLKENPYRSLQEIGNSIGRSRERVRQIIVKYNQYASTHNLEPIIRLKPIATYTQPHCITCGEERRSRMKWTIEKPWTCRPCKKEANRKLITCGFCKEEVLLTQMQSINRRTFRLQGKIKQPDRYFCSRLCASTAMGLANKRRWEKNPELLPSRRK